jgi:chorismate mutase
VAKRDFSGDEAGRLRRRLAELSEEVHNYPAPIARCDLQLAALLEERASVLAAIGRLESASSERELCKWGSDGGAHAG